MGFILKINRLDSTIRMPIDQAIVFSQRKLDQTTTARTTCTDTRIGHIGGAMRGAEQPAPGIVKKTPWLVVHLHRHMGAAVQISMHPLLVADGKSLAVLAGVHHVKSNSPSAMVQRTALAYGNRRDRSIRHASTC